MENQVEKIAVNMCFRHSWSKIFLVIVLASGLIQPTLAQDVGPINQEDQASSLISKSAPHFLKGQISFIPRGTQLKLKLATKPSYGMKLLEKDLDGNFPRAQVGQEISARMDEDLFVDNDKVIPEGTIFHGHVSDVIPPRRLRRAGSLVLSFDRITTPDGKNFAFTAGADNIKQSTLKTKAKTAGIIAAHAAAGAVLGALVAYEVIGIPQTIAMHGYNIAGGAVGGALLASGYAILQKGPEATLEPGDELNMQIDSDLLMPIAVEVKNRGNEPSFSGLNITIENHRLIKDGLGDQLLEIKALIVNETDERLSSIDLYVEDSNGNRGALCSNIEDDSPLLFSIEPHSRQRFTLDFTVQYPKLKQHLIWLEHEGRKICYSHSIP